MNGSNFRLVTGPEAEQSLAAWRASMEAGVRLLPPGRAARDLITGPFQPWEDEYIAAAWPGRSYNEIARFLDRPYSSVENRGYRVLGLRDPRRVRR